MKTLTLFFILCCLTIGIPAPPVTQKPGENAAEKDSEIKDNMEDYMEYHRYLKEVVAALESDPEFRQKLEKADYVDIRTGKIAHELDFVNHNIRSKLDEIKRKELERLLHLAKQQHELVNHIDSEHLKISTHEHLDHSNPHTFEIDDLKKLILKTTKDLEEADKKRRTEFKEYEMQKEFEKNQKIQTLDEDHRKEYEKQMHDQEEKHKKHEPLHHPGSRQQLEEVWEKQDHMDRKEFDPKVFFMVHDVDGNGVWDQNEVKALFLKELDKVYQNGAPEDDMRERQEEMERMREHLFQESDLNKDGLISYEEFLIQTRRPEFEHDQGWKGLDEQEIYTQQEYQEFERNRLEEVQRLIQQGVLPPQPIYGQDQQYPHGNPHMGYPQQGHPNQYPQQQQQYGQHQQQQQYPHQQQYPQQQHPQQQQYPPQQQFHPNQIPQGQQQQYHPNAVPQQQFQQQNVPPPNQQHHPNAPPQGQQQYNPNNVQNPVPQNQQQFQQPNTQNQQAVNPNQQPQQQGNQNQQPQQQVNQNQQPQQPNAVNNPPPVPSNPQPAPNNQNVPQQQQGQNAQNNRDAPNEGKPQSVHH